MFEGNCKQVGGTNELLVLIVEFGTMRNVGENIRGPLGWTHKW